MSEHASSDRVICVRVKRASVVRSDRKSCEERVPFLRTRNPTTRPAQRRVQPKITKKTETAVIRYMYWWKRRMLLHTTPRLQISTTDYSFVSQISTSQDHLSHLSVQDRDGQSNQRRQQRHQPRHARDSHILCFSANAHTYGACSDRPVWFGVVWFL